MKTITLWASTIMLGILLLSCVSSLEIIAGEPFFLKVNEAYVYWKVTGNLTEVNVIANETGVIITSDKYSKEDTFVITFYNKKDEVVVQGGQQSGGGSSYIKKEIIMLNDIEELNETIEEDVEEEVEEEIYHEEITEEEKKNIWKYFLLSAIVLLLIWAILYLKFLRTTRIRTPSFPQQNVEEESGSIKRGKNE